VLENYLKYDLRALEQIGYQIQGFVLERIEGWDDNEILLRFDFAVTAIRHLLSPSFEGHEMKDYQNDQFAGHFSLLFKNWLIIDRNE